MIAVIFFKKGPFLVFVGIALHHRWNAGITRLDWFPPFIICLSLKSSTSRLSWLSYNSLKVANLVEETEELLCKLAVTPKTAGLTRAYKGCSASFEHGSFFLSMELWHSSPWWLSGASSSLRCCGNVTTSRMSTSLLEPPPPPTTGAESDEITRNTVINSSKHHHCSRHFISFGALYLYYIVIK